MSLNWSPDVWGSLAASNKNLFLDSIEEMRVPMKSLHTKTYVACIFSGFLALSKYRDESAELRFFELLLDKLPHAEACSPSIYDLDRIKCLQVECAPIAYMQWRDALFKRLQPAKTLDYFQWLLDLRRPKYERDQAYLTFTLDKAPEWAAAYVEIQRGNSSRRLLAWLEHCPVEEALGVINAAGFLHAKEQVGWLVDATQCLFNRRDELYSYGSVFELTRLFDNSWQLKNKDLAPQIALFLTSQPEGLSLLGHIWFGMRYGNDAKKEGCFQTWWESISKENRGCVLARWLGETKAWPSILADLKNNKQESRFKYMVSSQPVEFTLDESRKIVEASPLEHAEIQHLLAAWIPLVSVSALFLDDSLELKNYVLSQWNTANETILNIDAGALFDSGP